MIEAAELIKAPITGAAVAVITVDWGVDTSHRRVAAVVATFRAIITVDERLRAEARVLVACVGRTGVSIVTVLLAEHAPTIRVARINSAWVAVRTLHNRNDTPKFLVAEISRALILVITGLLVDTTVYCRRVAEVYGARAPIIAVRGLVYTSVFRITYRVALLVRLGRTGIAIVAVDRCLAACTRDWVTDVFSTGVAIRAIEGKVLAALYRIAHIKCACTAIITVVHKHAADPRLAGVGGARIGVITELWYVEALPVRRAYVQRTIIVVRTVFRLELTARGWSTAVLSTEIAVFANHCDITTLAVHAAIIRTHAIVVTIIDCRTRRSGVAGATRDGGVKAARNCVTLVERAVDVIIAVDRLVETALL